MQAHAWHGHVYCLNGLVKSEDGRRTGPFKWSKTDYVINDVTTSASAELCRPGKSFLPVRNVSAERSESYG